MTGNGEGPPQTGKRPHISASTNQKAIRDLFKVARDTIGNLPPLPAIFPDWQAPIVRTNDGERELAMARWGMPAPFQFGGSPVTNIRNTNSPHWRRVAQTRVQVFGASNKF